MSCCAELLGCRHSFQKGGILQANGLGVGVGLGLVFVLVLVLVQLWVWFCFGFVCFFLYSFGVRCLGWCCTPVGYGSMGSLARQKPFLRPVRLILGLLMQTKSVANGFV